MMRKEQEPKRVSFGEAAKSINQGLEAADPMRLQGLTNLQRVRAVKAVSGQREQARLSQKLGADHPRVKALSARLAANSLLERDVKIGIERAQTPAAQLDPNAWTLHGHVRNQERTGLPNLTVALYDEKNQWIEELGYACTDARGYFRLTVKPRDVPGRQPPKDLTGKPTDATFNTGANGIATGRDPSVDAAGRRGAYIHVTNAKNATLYVDARPTTPKLGEVVYREIVIDGDGCECAPPGGRQPGTGTGGKEKEPEKTGRYLGNKNNHELHDMNNVKPTCQIDEIKADRREFFTSQRQAIAAGYDFCAHCFGKEKSKR